MDHWIVVIISLAAADSTMISLSWLLYAMTLYLEAQRTGQDEVDRVVGRGRVPDFGDMEDPVYVQALIKEILRWQPAGPLGFPHHLMEDDWYEGYLIPKGTTCIANYFCPSMRSTAIAKCMAPMQMNSVQRGLSSIIRWEAPNSD
ncbi:cytochrome P450 [Gymnopus androsaceus JB14]|uniref:Cytochrome P450 n=1 Tax=Gymnopus androsaceus JB14 TaxID=1447944 RepID=A0A6A4GG34_9AGAR|nr:cytochrome P450 [Gymnopus androsaceus JB14]